jgi:hypothetical protein
VNVEAMQEVRNWVGMQLYYQADQAAALDFTTINHDILSRRQLDTSAVSPVYDRAIPPLTAKKKDGFERDPGL